MKIPILILILFIFIGCKPEEGSVAGGAGVNERGTVYLGSYSSGVGDQYFCRMVGASKVCDLNYAPASCDGSQNKLGAGFIVWTLTDGQFGSGNMGFVQGSHQSMVLSGSTITLDVNGFSFTMVPVVNTNFITITFSPGCERQYEWGSL